MGACSEFKISKLVVRCSVHSPASLRNRRKMAISTNWTPREIPRLAKRLRARLHRVWSTSRTQLSRLVTKIKQFLSAMWSIFCWLLRRSELVSAFADNRKLQSEIPKKAIELKRYRALGKCSKHLLPVGITASLLVLNFSTVFWEAPGDPNQNASLDALQFAAKVHEILIVSSLSMIVLNHIQFELLCGSGIPIGGLFSGFQVSDVDLIWKPGLWATASAKEQSTRGTLLVLIVLVSITLGALSGPSSAILMLPSLDWWPGPFSFWPAATEFFIDSASSSLWPTEITTSNFLPPDCKFTDSHIPFRCPAGGFPPILAWGSAEIMYPWNLTISAGGYSLDYTRFLQGSPGFYNPIYNNDNFELERYMSQTTSAIASSALLAAVVFGEAAGPTRWMISSSNGSHLPAPQTFVVCDETDYDSLTSIGTNSSVDNILHFPLKIVANSTEESKTWSSAVRPLLDLWNPRSAFGALWIEPPDLGDRTPSIGVAVMANQSDVTNSDIITSITPQVFIAACSVYAGWRPAEVYVDTTDASVHSSTINDPTQVLSDWTWNRKNATSIQPIKLDIDWANKALPPNETLGTIYTALTHV